MDSEVIKVIRSRGPLGVRAIATILDQPVASVYKVLKRNPAFSQREDKKWELLTETNAAALIAEIKELLNKLEAIVTAAPVAAEEIKVEKGLVVDGVRLPEVVTEEIIEWAKWHTEQEGGDWEVVLKMGNDFWSTLAHNWLHADELADRAIYNSKEEWKNKH